MNQTGKTTVATLPVTRSPSRERTISYSPIFPSYIYPLVALSTPHPSTPLPPPATTPTLNHRGGSPLPSRRQTPGLPAEVCREPSKGKFGPSVAVQCRRTLWRRKKRETC
ncbi:hypothetical protein GWI33_023328 [Rhynchophorus ferrugineus]|uniref:Uncharacterized protein n=1 Tax=Rhynchophorus ferrugineus TaxID=354439 RepID=A0A834HTG6_RHYFE|nr:hypothetical protein GWI33_023328 [Rhynchophorus ferrugineus]